MESATNSSPSRTVPVTAMNLKIGMAPTCETIICHFAAGGGSPLDPLAE
jgi:hypothetical protein